MAAAVEYVDDRFAGIDIDSLLNGERRPMSYERKRALYEAPEFIQRLNGEETVMEGQALCIECKIRGFPVPAVRWFKDDEEMEDSHRIHIETNGLGGYFLIIDYVTRGDEAAYRCRAENVEGACSSFLFLSVRGKPKRRNPMYCPSWRTVSYPPMFSTIMEKVEEEEKQERELQELSPSPLTQFYYALTLKGRCSWPTFLGEWAFVTGHPGRHKYENFENSEDDNEADSDDDDDDDNYIDDKFGIHNGDTCDKIKLKLSNKGNLLAKRGKRYQQKGSAIENKKQRVDGGKGIKRETGNKERKIEENEENTGRKVEKHEVIKGRKVDEDGENTLGERKMKHDDEIEKRKCRTGEAGKIEQKDGERIGKEEFQKMKEGVKVNEKASGKNFNRKDNDIQMVTNENSHQGLRIIEVIEEKDDDDTQSSNWKDVERDNEDGSKEKEGTVCEEDERMKETVGRNDEEQEHRQTKVCQSEKKEEDIQGSEETKSEVMVDGDARNVHKLADGRTKSESNNGLFQAHNDCLQQKSNSKLEVNRRSNITDQLDVDLKSNSTDELELNQKSNNTDELDLNDFLISKMETNSETKPAVETVHMIRSNTGEGCLNNNERFTKSVEVKHVQNKCQEIIYNESKNETYQRNNNGYKKSVEVKYGQNKSQEIIYNESKNVKMGRKNEIFITGDESREVRSYVWGKLEDVSLKFGNRYCRKTSVEAVTSSWKERKLQKKENVAKKEFDCQDRLEMLRRENEKRLEELKQQELKRVEELKAEEVVAFGRLFKRDTLPREDLRSREKKQIEDLQRREHLQREELRQKEMKQREELRKREEKHKEEIQFQEGIITGKITIREEETLNKQRMKLRVKEVKQLEELKVKECQHKEELNLQEFIQKKELIAHEQKQIDELKLKEGVELKDGMWGEGSVLQGLENNGRRTNRQDLLLQSKKEQLIKEQLRIQHEEDLRRRHTREEAETKMKERSLDGNIDTRNIGRHEGYLFGNLRQSSGPTSRGEIVSCDKFTKTDNVINNLNCSNNNSRKCEFSVSSLKTDTEINLRERDKGEISAMKGLHSGSDLEELFTKSLDRRQTRFSKHRSDDDLEARQFFRTEKNQRYLETEHMISNSRRLGKQGRQGEREISNLLLKSDSHIGKENLTKSLTSSLLSNSCSFASLFALDEKKNSNPALLTHEELFKLAESIASTRQIFHEQISRDSFVEISDSSSENTHKSTSINEEKTDQINEKSKNNADVIFHNNQSHGNEQHTEEVNKTRSYIFHNSMERQAIQSLAPRKALQDKVQTMEPSLSDVRPLIYNSTRTVARKLFKQDYSQ